jgi:hypothetical protein
MFESLLRSVARLDPRSRHDACTQDRFTGEQSLLFHPVPNTDTLFIFFGSMTGKLGTLSPFEFLRSTTPIPAHKLYLRDFYQSYYHHGIYGYTQDIPETQNLIDSLLHEYAIDTLVCVGHCAGGYAAILFGALVGADVVHAFSPQTFFSIGQKLVHIDPRFHQYTRKMYATTADTRYFDLNNLAPDPSTQFILHYRTSLRHERLHVNHLAFKNVVRRAYLGHTPPVRQLRDKGVLIDVLTRATPIAFPQIAR